MKKILAFILIMIFAFTLVSCAAGGSYSDDSAESSSDITTTGEVEAGEIAFLEPGTTSLDGTDAAELFAIGYVMAWASLSGRVISYLSQYHDGLPGEQPPAPAAGTLTASAWNDFLNYGFWQSLFTADEQDNAGVFADFLKDQYFNTNNMIEVTVTSGSELVKGATVSLLDAENNALYVATTNVLGLAYLYPKNTQLNSITSVKVTLDDQTKTTPFTYTALTDDQLYHRLSFDLAVSSPNVDTLELMFVIDTTGSMGDELSYLQEELVYVVEQVKAENPTTEVKVALLFYRDTGDEYVTKYSDFSTFIELQQSFIAYQESAGGGDWEEAVDRALDEAVNKNWSTDSTTKILVHVMDAPPHYTDDTVMQLYSSSLLTASAKGIRIIPVAGSGIDKYTEYLLRCEAMLTGGIYTFLTDDSGVGGEHVKATTGDTVVEYLNNLLVRLINEYHNGKTCDIIPYYNDQPNRK